MALIAPKRAQEERNALHGLFTWYAPSVDANESLFMNARFRWFVKQSVLVPRPST
jgi:hypothetical protein